jgi:hypothetical protein
VGNSRKSKRMLPPRRVGTGRGKSKPAGGRWSARRTRLRLHALARGAGLDERLHGCREAGPPYGAADQGEGLVASEVAAERSRVKLPQHLHADLARCWDAQAVAARALAVERPVARDEEAGLRAGSWAGRAGSSGDRIGGVGLGGC